MMNNELRPYKENKSTNMLWGGEIPAHWNVVRTKQIFSNEKKLNKFNQCNNILSLTLRGVVNNNYEKPEGLVPKDYATYQIFEKDNLVFKLIDLENYKTSRVGIVHEMGIMSPAYIRLIQHGNTNAKYFYYQYYDLYLRGVYNQLGEGVRLTLSAKDLLNMPIIVPTIDEQDQIVKYLDYQLAKINKFIKAKKKLIAVLKEQKQAIINEAVTKGLNPNVKMKPSGVEWLGDVPEHWDIARLRNLLKPTSTKNGEGLPLLSVVREKGVMLRSEMSTEENHNFIPDDLSGYKVVKKGQFAMNKMKAWQGSYGVSSYDGIVSPAYYIFDVLFENKEYFHYAIRSKFYVNYFAKSSEGIRVGQWDLSLSKMKKILFLVPSPEEQQKIVEYIPVIFAKIDNSLLRLNNEIDLMTEYKAKLISDLVTGKVDVRNIIIKELEEDIIEDTELEEELVDEEVLAAEDGDE